MMVDKMTGAPLDRIHTGSLKIRWGENNTSPWGDKWTDQLCVYLRDPSMSGTKTSQEVEEIFWWKGKGWDAQKHSWVMKDDP